ncbi:MAG: type II toxin-antitoxin system VapC family toxin [Gammaproteobacteria bacterium]|nr:type II toxin-antitoxin system VapC family toxin [Gammaproteobacteria bacterium]
MTVLLDTHVWVWWLSGGGRLSKRERVALDGLAARRELRLAAISLWEVQMAFAKGRFQPVDGFDIWLFAATVPEVIQIVPIDVQIILTLNDLPAAMSSDPADRLIVATARTHSFPLVTYDSNLRKSRAARLWQA